MKTKVLLLGSGGHAKVLLDCLHQVSDVEILGMLDTDPAFTVIHPSAIISKDIFLGEGAQFMAGSIVQAGCVFGDNVLLNTGASLDHDGQIGSHVHLAPGVVCSGHVSIGACSHVGVGSVIIQSISIGKGCLVAAGAIVVNDFADDSKIIGIPAKKI